jgi:hypothetical protein
MVLIRNLPEMTFAVEIRSRSVSMLDSHRNTKLLTLSNVNITAKQQQIILQRDINQPSKL